MSVGIAMTSTTITTNIVTAQQIHLHTTSALICQIVTGLKYMISTTISILASLRLHLQQVLCLHQMQMAAPWISPAGGRRGQYLGVTSTVYSPTKAQRDTLYKAGVNPVGNIPGQGVLLFGDKTHMNRPSAFDRINVRRLFLT